VVKNIDVNYIVPHCKIRPPLYLGLCGQII
jgi:hypothetical protein